jgi:type II secretory pathway predicted ATPase ExeA
MFERHKIYCQEVINMSQAGDFINVIETAQKGVNGVIFVVGKPGSGKSKVMREAAEDKKWELC